MIGKLLSWFSAAWRYLRPLIESEVARFAADPEVRSLALDCVERAAGLDLNGDGKFKHAGAELRERLKAIGRDYRDAGIAIAIQAAYEWWIRHDPRNE